MAFVKMSRCKVICILFCSISIVVTRSQDVLVSFQDFQEQLRHCSSNNFTCATSDSFYQTCNCQPSCIESSTCCYDAQFYDKTNQIQNIDKQKCVTYNHLYHAFMITQCKEGWKNREVSDLCSVSSPSSISRSKLPLLHLPVTSRDSNLTYANYYCAFCNEDTRNINAWQMELSCYNEDYSINTGLNEEYIKTNISYNEGKGSWEVIYPFRGVNKSVECKIEFIPPVELLKSCYPVIDDCDVNWTNLEIKELCQSIYAPVEDYFNSYRNIFCALCNYITISKHSVCGINVAETFLPPSFKTLLCPIKITQNHSYDQCETEEQILPAYNPCCSKICELNRKNYQYSSCIYTEILKNASIPENCSYTFVNKIDYTVRDGIVTVGSDYKFLKGQYNEHPEGIVVCLPYQEFSVSAWVTSVGLVISVLGLVLHLIVFSLVKDLRNLPGKNLASLCSSLLVAYISFVMGSFLDKRTVICYVSASLMYFSFISVFCWTNVIAFDTWQTFRKAIRHFESHSSNTKYRYTFYFLYCFLFSATALVVLVTIDQTSPKGFPQILIPQLGQKSCWFGQSMSLLLFFIGPMMVSVTANLAFFLLTAWNLRKASTDTRQVTACSQDRTMFKVHIRLAVLMGLTWVSGVIAWFVDTEPAWYIFAIFNSLQGTFIFLSFTVRRKVWRAVISICGFQRTDAAVMNNGPDQGPTSVQYTG